MLNSKIIDISSGVPSQWEVLVDKKDSHHLDPVLACLYSGLVPVFMTFTCKDKPYFGQIMKYKMDLIEKAMLTNRLFRELRVTTYCDEIINVPDVAMPHFVRIAKAGRMKRLGLLWASQFGADVSKLIYKNTDFLFMFRHAELSDVKKIQKSYKEGMREEMIDEVMSLKNFECLALTKKHFVAYDLSTGERETGSFYKGKILPPLSLHKRPNAL